jgi:mersacidin/lichenicidin family type 2 lantibiotic
MPHRNVVRAWKDPEYRRGLSAAEQGQLPDNPAGAVELTDAELGGVSGGMPPTCDECTDMNFCGSVNCGSASCTNGPVACFVSCMPGTCF